MSIQGQRLYSDETVHNLRSIDKTKALSFIIHAADIAHPSKKWDLHYKWTTNLLEEFFRQVLTWITE